MTEGYWDEDGTYLDDANLHEQYSEMLDDAYPEIVFGSSTYYPSNVLAEVDPVAYRCGFNDWLDAEISDGRIFESDPTEDDEDEDGEWSIPEWEPTDG